MDAIIRYESDFHYLKFQPGDGTMYTAVYGDLTDPEERYGNIYVAVGSADYIRGGYMLRHTSLYEMLLELRKWIDADKLPIGFVKKYHLFAYFDTKMSYGQTRNATWTDKMAVLLAAVITWGTGRVREDLKFIGHVYYNHNSEILALLDEWGIDEEVVAPEKTL